MVHYAVFLYCFKSLGGGGGGGGGGGWTLGDMHIHLNFCSKILTYFTEAKYFQIVKIFELPKGFALATLLKAVLIRSLVSLLCNPLQPTCMGIPGS